MFDESTYAAERLEPVTTPTQPLLPAHPVRHDRKRLLGFVLIGVGVALLVRSWTFDRPATRTMTIPLDATEQSLVNIHVGNGSLRIMDTADPACLVCGHTTQGSFVVNNAGDRQSHKIDVKIAGSGFFPFGIAGTSSDLELNTQPHYKLNVNTGNGRTMLDLQHLMIDHLDVATGNGPISIRLPQQGNVTGKVEAGNGAIQLQAPAERSMRLHVQHGNGSLNPGSLGMVSGSDHDAVYQSPGWATTAAQDRIDLDIELGNGSLAVSR